MSEAVVGSISHILKTAFKEVYAESDKRANAIKLREEHSLNNNSNSEGDEPASDNDNKELLENYYSPFEKLTLNDDIKQLSISKKKDADTLLGQLEDNALDLATYMKTQKEIARELEETENDNLKRQGIFVGLHVPVLPTKLSVSRQKLESHGSFSSNLIVANELVGQNIENSLRRTGNLPISDLAELRKTERLKHHVQKDDDIPHYLEVTKATSLREERITTRYEVTTHSRNIEKAKTMAASGGPEAYAAAVAARSLKTKNSKHGILSVSDQLANEEILKGMNHKLNYLRNPRNDINSVTNKMLTKNKKSIDIIDDIANAESETSVKSSGSSSKKTKKSYGKAPPVSNNPLFQTEPKNLIFHGFNIGGVYTTSVSFRNVSAVTRMIRVLPPAGERFSMQPLKFPPNCKGGMIAPGMSVTTTITFIPDTLLDLNDELIVETEGGNYAVPIIAYRDNPIFNIPTVVDIGFCFVGDAIRVAIPCLNSGGPGKFTVLKPEQYPDIPTDIDWEREGCQRFPPFTIYPVEISLQRNEVIDVNIEYLPLKLGSYEQEFILLGENGAITRHLIKAMCTQIDIKIAEVNTQHVDNLNTLIAKDLFFESANIGSENNQEIVIANDSGIPIEFEWVWIDMHVKDILKVGKQKIAERLRAEAIRTASTRSRTVKDDVTLNEFLTLPPPPPTTASKSRGNSASSSPAKSRDAKTPQLKNLAESTSEDDEEVRAYNNNSPANHVMTSMSDTDIFVPSNVATAREFELTPARGVFPSEGDCKFTISFTPTELNFTSMRAVLFLKGVPAASLPDPKLQPQFLQNLELEGHGSFYRLCSWIEALSSPALVNSIEKNSNIAGIPESMNLINLQTLFDLACNHAPIDNPNMWENMQHLKLWIASMVIHTYNWRKAVNGLDSDDEEESEVLDSNQYSAISYDWNGDESVSPNPIKPIILTTMITEPYYNDEGELEEAEKMQFQEITNGPEEVQLRKEIWVNVNVALHLLGNNVCNLLDHLIKHEAVEYLHKISQSTVVCLSTGVSGAGKIQNITTLPPELQVGGLLTIGKEWFGKVSFHNNSTAMAEIEINKSMMQVLSLHEVLSKETTTSSLFLDSFHVEFDPPRILLMPETSAEINVSVIIRMVGQYKIIIPVTSTNVHAQIDSINILCHTVGPRIRFDSPEVDIGLVGVGDIGSKSLSFTNEGDVPLKLFLKPLLEDTSDNFSLMTARSTSKSDIGGKKTHRSEGNHTARSQGSGKSGSRDSFMIENQWAQLFIEPPAINLLPQQTVSVSVSCKSGANPQRVRGMIEGTLYDVTGVFKLPSQCISVRGEIQAPKTIMYPMQVDLGVVYIGMPVTFKVTIENMCNLPTKYRLERPGGEASNFKVDFDFGKGPLGPKEKVVVICTFTALTAGIIDEVIANKIFGVQNPLGFTMKAVSKGVQLEFSHLPFDQDPPLPLGKPTDTQYKGVGKVPEPNAIVPLEIGGDILLYGRKNIRMVIRNLSAIPAPFKMNVKKFIVANPSKLGGKRIDNDDDNKARKDLVLQPHEDGSNKFHSKAGKEYIGVRVQRDEDRDFLTSLLGASYYIEPNEGTLQPWGVQVVTIHVCNDMPGCYDDELYCDIVDGSSIRRFIQPTRFSVQGCPLFIDKNPVGMTTIRLPLDDPNLGMQQLRLGQGCVDCEPLVRNFRVKNNGSKPGCIRWRLQTITSTARGLLRVRLGCNNDGKSKVDFAFWSEVTKDLPFKIEPQEATIGPYEDQMFKVTLFRTCNAGIEEAMLSGAIDLNSTDDQTSIIDINSSVVSNETKKSNTGATYNIKLALHGNFVYPTIRFDKCNFTASESPTLIEDRLGIKMKTQAPKLFRKGIKLSDDDACSRPITLVNPLDNALIFSVSTEGPYNIKVANDDSTKGSFNKQNIEANNQLMSQSTSKIDSIVSSVGSYSMGKMFNLLSNASTSFAVAFTPKRELREKLMNNLGGEQAEERGKLIITYSTGQSLHIPLHTTISTPFVSTSSPKMYFGVCHVTKITDGTLLLSNPTTVSAHWIVTHLPGAGSSKKPSSIRVKGYVDSGPEIDDPTVFEITPNNGTIDGPTVSVSAAIGVPPKDVNRNSDNVVVPQRLMESSWQSNTLTLRDSLQIRHNSQGVNASDPCFPIPLVVKFLPKKNVKYSSCFRFSCEFGNSFDVILQGSGTYEEHEHKPINPIPR